jgi:hypothetical protein
MHQQRKSVLFSLLYVVTSNIPRCYAFTQIEKAQRRTRFLYDCLYPDLLSVSFLTEPNPLRRSKETLLTYSTFFNAAACRVEAQWGAGGCVLSIFPYGMSSSTVQGRRDGALFGECICRTFSSCRQKMGLVSQPGACRDRLFPSRFVSAPKRGGKKCTTGFGGACGKCRWRH